MEPIYFLTWILPKSSEKFRVANPFFNMYQIGFPMNQHELLHDEGSMEETKLLACFLGFLETTIHEKKISSHNDFFLPLLLGSKMLNSFLVPLLDQFSLSSCCWIPVNFVQVAASAFRSSGIGHFISLPNCLTFQGVSHPLTTRSLFL